MDMCVYDKTECLWYYVFIMYCIVEVSTAANTDQSPTGPITSGIGDMRGIHIWYYV